MEKYLYVLTVTKIEKDMFIKCETFISDTRKVATMSVLDVLSREFHD